MQANFRKFGDDPKVVRRTIYRQISTRGYQKESNCRVYLTILKSQSENWVLLMNVQDRKMIIE